FPAAGADEKAAKAAPPEKAVESFDEAWKIIQRTHYDPKLNGVDWDKVKQELRPKAQAAKTTEELRDVLREMLKRLGESHSALLPRGAVHRLEATPPAKAEKGDKPPAVLRPEDRPKPAVAGAPDAAKDKAPAADRAPKADKPAAKDKPESGKDDTPVPGEGKRARA